MHRSLAVDEWAILRYGDQKDDSFARGVGAFDLFILDEAPEGDINDVCAGRSGPFLHSFQPLFHVNVTIDLN
jgi:hypothetical protein